MVQVFYCELCEISKNTFFFLKAKYVNSNVQKSGFLLKTNFLPNLKKLNILTKYKISIKISIKKKIPVEYKIR